MQILDRIQNHINDTLKAIGVTNTVLNSVGRSKPYKYMLTDFSESIKKQIDKIVNEHLFEVIHSQISKVDVIFTENDESVILKTVQEEIKKHPISDFVSDTVVAGYLISIFEKGGQSFLDKHNLPKTFKLTNETIREIIKQRPAVLFKGIDETTSKWISDQIVVGKKSGVSNQDLIDTITDEVPSYSEFRAETIVRTESASMIGQSEQVTASKNGASHKDWMTAEDDRVSDECMANEAQGTIGIDSRFVSGAFVPPQHPNCRCVVNYQFTPYQGFIWNGQ